MNFEIGKLILAFIVLMNPFGALPVFLELTRNFTKRECKRTAQISSIAVFIIFTVVTFIGNTLLNALGISTGSFRIGGGILVFMIAMSMMNGDNNPTKPDIGVDDHHEITIKQPERANVGSIAVVPLAMPMVIGPGGISTIIIQASAARNYLDFLMIVAAGGVISLLCYIVFLSSNKVSALLGDTGLVILNRIMGMLMAAVAVEIIVAGLRDLFPKLIG
ncbi:MarC family protein [Kingella negevensis]|uniref:MarC family protein n=1 Tax=Kingella negevensis TaxID=1522312 RepID=UPI00254CA4ED|nr:MarC family protein [Kingella negevensis]MDK4684787.1 MarC family protein [Kingella negevensis]MDK4707328.1 MarC family protein [Kingella negevensis]MDK4710194.1 MarC family protein [Kingella negevensis]